MNTDMSCLRTSFKRYESKHAASQPLANLQDCQRKWHPALGLSPHDYYIPTHINIFVQHYCIFRFYRIFATVLHKIILMFDFQTILSKIEIGQITHFI
jgi:hypothetical protein